MFKIPAVVLGVAVGGLSLTCVDRAQAELLDIGTTFSLGINFGTAPYDTIDPSDGSTVYNNIPLVTGMQTFDNNTYDLTIKTNNLPGGSEFVEFYVNTVDGTPLVLNGATNINNFYIAAGPIQFTKSLVTSNVYFDFVTNGVANSSITGWPDSGFGVATNPNSASIGAGMNAFYFTGFSPGPPSTTTSYYEFQYPFGGSAPDSISAMNIDPNATGYFFGFEVSSSVPEPSTWAMMLIGFAGLSFAGYRRAKKSTAGTAG